jgi:ATP phosphoribosyltransferase
MISVALPKGRLGESVYRVFEEIGYGCPEIMENSRKLIFENEENCVSYFWAKPSDVAVYVERGAADVGIAGLDILLEQEPDVFELIDLGFGKCRMVVAGKKDAHVNTGRTLKVATKFPNIAKKYYAEQSREIEIIKLNGSIELAPIVKLSDVIVDIVETGKTLKENDLEVLETICDVSARLIVNKSAFRFKTEQIEQMCARLRERTK